ncbi:MAG TPA: outer membrane beta-barrel protein, partial [Pedobacter sp.]|nr:outer membrane beta-barrel protein [Pedobacter sp.]
MKKGCLTFLFLLIAFKLFSQTLTILDSIRKDAVVGATVVVLDASTNALRAQAVSDSNGRVSITETNQSRYVSVTAVGYKKVVQLFKDSLQKIFLVPLSKQLDQVTIKSNKSPINIAGNVMEFDISQVPNADYMNVGEIIEQLPFLQIVDNNIRMMNENLVILIDNRPNSIYKDAASLKSLPPHAIDKMEVVLTPTARNGGKVLNITLKRDYFLGWNSTISSSSNRLGVSPSASMTYWRKKAGFDLSVSYNNGLVNGTSETNINYTTQKRVLNENEKSRSLTNSGRISVSSYYNLSDKDAIDFQFNFAPSKTNYTSSSQIFSQSLNNSYTDFSEINRRSSARGYVVGLNYTHKYHNTANAFYLLTRYSTNATNNTQDLQSSSNGMTVLTDNVYLNNIDNSESTIEIIQQQNSGKKLKYVIGSKLIFRDNGNDNTLTNISIVKTIVKMNQLVSSSYVDGDWTFSKFTAHTGLRLDYNKNQFSSPMQVQQSFTNLTPTVSLSYNINKTESLLLSYVRRILRPSFYYTDPVVNPVNAYERSGGSTDLQNQINNEWGLQYYGNYKFGSLGFSLNYSRTSGLISTLSTLSDDN